MARGCSADLTTAPTCTAEEPIRTSRHRQQTAQRPLSVDRAGRSDACSMLHSMRAVASEPLSPGEQPPELWRARRRPRRPPCQKCHGVRYIPYVKGLNQSTIPQSKSQIQMQIQVDVAENQTYFKTLSLAWSHACDQGWCLVLRSIPTAPCTDQKPLGGGTGFRLAVPSRSPGLPWVVSTIPPSAGPCREGGLSSIDERVRGHVTEVTQALRTSSKWSPRRPHV